MRTRHFEALAPVCPRCLHAEGAEHPLAIAEVAERRGGDVWHGILHCRNSACWMEFPIVDGVPIIVMDPATTLSGARAQVLMRERLPGALPSLVGDALGAGSEFDTLRQHLSIYARAHYGDWFDDGAEEAGLLPLIQAAIDLAAPMPDGPALDLGGSVGRTGFELLGATSGLVLDGDLNLSMLRLAQALITEGRATVDRRRVGLVYDGATIEVPAGLDVERMDAWAVDALALPFRPGTFALATALNLVDCVADPSRMILEVARMLRPGAAAVFASPYDWAATVAEPARWFGGHSQRSSHGGASEEMLRAHLAAVGLAVSAERGDVPWRLRLHERAQMHYVVDVVATVRGPAA